MSLAVANRCSPGFGATISLLIAAMAPGAVSARSREAGGDMDDTVGIGGTTSVLGFFAHKLPPRDGRLFPCTVEERVGLRSPGNGSERCLELLVEGVLLCDKDPDSLFEDVLSLAGDFGLLLDA